MVDFFVVSANIVGFSEASDVISVDLSSKGRTEILRVFRVSKTDFLTIYHVYYICPILVFVPK